MCWSAPKIGRAAGRDRAGMALRFNIPTVVNGHVYVGAKHEVDSTVYCRRGKPVNENSLELGSHPVLSEALGALRISVPGPIMNGRRPPPLLASENPALRLATKNRSVFRLMLLCLVIAELLDGALPEGLHCG